MARGNGTIAIQKPVRLPPELVVVIESYQKHRRLPSFNAAVIELLESHQQIVLIVNTLYADHSRITEGT
jgi:hypothetical protein